MNHLSPKHHIHLLTAYLLLPSLTCSASTTVDLDWTLNSTIPDNSPTGLVDSRVISGSSISMITSVEVRLRIDGGWNGDLYVFLSHDSGITILLNRPGKTESISIGSGSSGFDIILSDDAVSDMHTPTVGSGPVTGTFQPDAREDDPLEVLDTSPRTAYLSVFQGMDSNGTWTLFLADNVSGDESTLVEWGMSITGIPEPSSAVLLLLGAAGIIIRRRRSSE